MAALHLRDVDEILVRKLHERARANGRSAAEEHRQILRSALVGEAQEHWLDTAARLRKSIAERRKREGIPAGPLAEELIRESRDRRANDEPDP